MNTRSEVDLSPFFEPIREAQRRTQLPGVEEGLSWGTPGLKVKGKMILRIREPQVIVICCDFDEKELLMQAAPEIYFQTDHYKGSPHILIRLSEISNEELDSRIEKAWRLVAPKKLTRS